MLDFLVRVSKQQRWKNRKQLAFLSVTVWEPGSLGLVWLDLETQAWAGHTRQPTRETTERDAEMRRKWLFFGGVNVFRHHVPGAVRCSAPSRTSEVRIPELVACQSAPAPVAHGPVHKSAGAGSGSICLASNAPVACSSLASSTTSWNSASLCARS